MTAKDLSVVVRGIAPVVREYVALGLTSLADRLTAVEVKQLTVARNGRDGEAGAKGLDGQAGAQGERGPEGPVGPTGSAGERGEHGIDGQRGADGERGPEGAAGLIGPSGERGEKGLDGLLGASGERGLDGPEGKPGRDGRDGLAGIGEKGLNGADGRHGVDGKDGLGFDDFEELYDGERTFTHRYRQGDRVKEFVWKMPIELYRGVYTEGKTYDRGDGTTWAGSEWHCNELTTTKPGDGSKSWTMKVKRGRDGKDGKDGVAGKSGLTLKVDEHAWRR